MNNKQRNSKHVCFIIGLVMLLNGCGLKGPLYAPEQRQPTKQSAGANNAKPPAAQGSTVKYR